MTNDDKCKHVTPLQNTLPPSPRRERTAVYARVSLDSADLKHSLSAQVSYYSRLIQQNPQWEYAGVYADCGISGTSGSRPQWQRLLSDCHAGKIDIILTKSVSRFARNTVDLLTSIRQLKALGVAVRFEKEQLDSATDDGELMLTILASFAQEESRSISDNVKWRIRKKFEQGIPAGRFRVLGYHWEEYQMVIIPEEAAIVRYIFQNFLKGKSRTETKKELDAAGLRTASGYPFCDSSIRGVLRNITYTGNTLLQKTFITDPIHKVRRYNRGELPQFFVKNTHEAIISMDIFREVQARMMQPGDIGNRSCFSGHVRCGNCGSMYERSTRRCGKNKEQEYTIWICRSKRKNGAAYCWAKSIPEHILETLSGEILQLSSFDPKIFTAEIETIAVVGCDKLVFHFKNGRALQRQWHSTARTDCWTTQRREQFSRQCKGINRNPHTQNPFTGLIRCPYCEHSAVHQLRHYKDGTSAAFWHCRTKGCGNASKIWEDTLKDMVRDVSCLPYSVQYMELVDTRTVKICYTDGHCEAKSFQQTRKMRTRKADGRD